MELLLEIRLPNLQRYFRYELILSRYAPSSLDPQEVSVSRQSPRKNPTKPPPPPQKQNYLVQQKLRGPRSTEFAATEKDSTQYLLRSRHFANRQFQYMAA